MTWPEYQQRLRAAGYRALSPPGAGYEHKQTGRVIYPRRFQPQPDGTSRLNWQYWAEQEPPFVPPPF